jgi:hypothetical protein
MIDNEDVVLLSAFLDSELEGQTANALRERLIRDPALRRELEALKQGDAMLKDFASQIDSRPVSTQMQAAIKPRNTRNRVLATAASVLLLVAAGVLFVPSQTTEVAALESLGLIESGERIATATGYLEVVASFHHRDGRICREFATADKQGIACLPRTGSAESLGQDSGGWQEILFVPLNGHVEGSYQPAGVGELTSLDEYIAKNMDGEVLGLSAERKLIVNNWQQ